MGSFGYVWNFDFLACWTRCQHKPNCMATIDLPLIPPPMAAFLVGRTVRLRVHLRKPAARNAGAEAADGNKAVVFHIYNLIRL